jgi:hypothetical protein
MDNAVWGVSGRPPASVYGSPAGCRAYMTVMPLTEMSSTLAASLQGCLDAITQRCGGDRLGEETDGARCHRLLARGVLRKRRHEDDGDEMTLRGQSALQLEPIHARHLDIGDEATGLRHLWRV